jgi:hypothetical protein
MSKKSDSIDLNKVSIEGDVSPVGGIDSVYKNINGAIGGQLFNNNPMILVIIVAIIIIFVLLFESLGVTSIMQGQQVQSSPSSDILELLVWGLLIFLILINGLQYFFDLDVKTAISGIFSNDPQIKFNVSNKDGESIIEEEDEIIEKKEEVFHIPGNVYNYKEAGAVCKAHNAELADYSQVEEAYNNGGEWCSYGWSKNQMALFPTQKATWNKIQKMGKCGENKGNNCGRPGINGGYIANANARFGVNCYGVKPDAGDKTKAMIKKFQPFPKSKEEIAIEKLAEKYKEKLNDMKVSPFNYTNWKQI